jgi:hypothetical protein
VRSHQQAGGQARQSPRAGRTLSSNNRVRAELSKLFAFAFASTALGSRFIRTPVPLDRRVLKATIGRKSGLLRSSALSFRRDGDRLLLLGSNFGQDRHPSWPSDCSRTLMQRQ